MARTALALLLFLGVIRPPVAPGQSFDLTGFWQDEHGTRYRLRHVGSELYWYMDGAPRVVNVFAGTIAGREVTGTWADLPGGELRNSGQLALRIESNDRFVKVGESQSYGGSVWTRQGTAAVVPPPAPAAGGAPGNVWGTDVYTDDSSVCTAAVHAGLISLAGGGAVEIEIRSGLPGYLGSSRNGVSSSGYGAWPAS